MNAYLMEGGDINQIILLTVHLWYVGVEYTVMFRIQGELYKVGEYKEVISPSNRQWRFHWKKERWH